MRRRRIFLIGTLLTLVGCAPSADTDDENVNDLVDLVVAKEAPFSQCVEIRGRTLVVEYPADYQGPILGLQTDSYENEELKAAAGAVAVSLQEAMQSKAEKFRIIGKPDTIDGTGSCTMRVSYPLFSKGFAFVEFSAPSGTIGAYAFERTLGRWRAAERSHFGYW